MAPANDHPENDRPEKDRAGKDPLRLAIHLVVYVVLFLVTATIAGWVLTWVLDAYLVSNVATFLFSAVFANWLALRIYANRRLIEVGLWLNRASAENLVTGLAGGAGAAFLVLAPPLALGVARLGRTPDDQPTAASIIFVTFLLIAGAIGEELLFRGYGFQVLLAELGAYATIVPVGVVFALLHGSNPGATWFSTANTAGFGIVFGFAYLRSRDLWLPIGLHFGWNFTLPLFGVNVSGLRMKVTGYEMSWTAGNLWSGGDYGPEASVLTSVVLVLLFVYLWKVPIRRQPSPLTGPSPGSPVCEPSSLLPS